MDNIILDESFIEFAGTPESVIDSFYEYKNLTIIRSMSKIFGIAGIRAGFCITKAEYVEQLLNSGYLWNSNCFAIFFFELLNNKELDLEDDDNMKDDDEEESSELSDDDKGIIDIIVKLIGGNVVYDEYTEEDKKTLESENHCLYYLLFYLIY